MTDDVVTTAATGSEGNATQNPSVPGSAPMAPSTGSDEQMPAAHIFDPASADRLLQSLVDASAEPQAVSSSNIPVENPTSNMTTLTTQPTTSPAAPATSLSQQPKMGTDANQSSNIPESILKAITANTQTTKTTTTATPLTNPPAPIPIQPTMNPPNLPIATSPTKRPASLESEAPAAKRIKIEPIDDTQAILPETLASLANATPVSVPSAATSTQSAPAPVSTPTAAPIAAQAPATTSVTPIASIEKSPSVKLEPGKETATPEPVKETTTPTSQTRAPAHPRKRRRMLEAPAQALRGMNMQLLGITAVQVLEWLSQEPFEESIDALRDLDSDFYASYSFKVTQFEQAWRNFSQTDDDLLVWSKLGLDDQKHRKTVRLANLARFGIDLFSEDETYLPTLHERFFQVFVYGTRKFTFDHSNILLELKTQLALSLLAENTSGKTPADLLHEVFTEGLESVLKERSWNQANFDEELGMLTSAEIRMSLLLQEYEESGNNAQVLVDRYPPDSLLKQLGSYIHNELVAHADHCQTLAVSARAVGKQQTTIPAHVALQDDDDYWKKTNSLIDGVGESIMAEIKGLKPASEEKPTDAVPGAVSTSQGTDNQPSVPSGTPQPQAAAAPASSAESIPALSEEMQKRIGAILGPLFDYMNQRIASREAELAQAALPATPVPNLAHHDTTAQNLYLLKAAQMPQAQQGVYGQQIPGAAQGATPAGPPLVPMPGHAQGHVPVHPLPHAGLGQVHNHITGPAAGRASGAAAPGELPPNQTCPTSILYDKARQAALSKSTAHTRREGIHSTRRPWTPEEEKALMTGLDMVKGPHWSQILSLFGPNGTISDVLKDRTQVQLKDKARNLKLFFLKTQSEMPYYLSAVTGELKTRAPNQAARKEAEERARLSREEDQAKAQGLLSLSSSLQNSPQLANHGQAGAASLARKQTPGVVTPAQAALAAQITTPAMAQGQAQSAAAQRPIQASPVVSNVTQAAIPASAPTVTPSPRLASAPNPLAHLQASTLQAGGTTPGSAANRATTTSTSPAPPTPAQVIATPATAQRPPQASHLAPSPSVHAQVGGQRPIALPQARPQVSTQGQPQTYTPATATPASTQPSVPTASTSAIATASTATAPATSAPTPTPPAATPTTQPKMPTLPLSVTSLPNFPTTSTSAHHSALHSLAASRISTPPVTLSQSFPTSTIPANLFSRVTEAEATNAALLERLRAEVAKEARSG